MKKIIAMLLAVLMVVCLFAGCAPKADAPAKDEPAKDEPAKDDDTASDAPADGAFKIGSSGPLTGDAAIYGLAVKYGAEIAVEEINAAGGVNGYMIDFRMEDDIADGETAVNAYNTLYDWGMQVMAGTVTSGSCISMSAVAAEDRVFCLTPSASSTDVLAGKDNMYQLCFSDPNQGTGSATYMGAKMADAKIAVIYRNDDAYSQGIRDTFVAEAKNQNLNVVYEGTFTKDTQTYFSVQLTVAQAAGADIVFLHIYYQPASVIFNQASQMGYAPTFFGVDGMDGILTMEGFDPALAEGVMLLTPFSADAGDDLTKNFVAKYQEAHGEVPNQFAADGYDTIYAIAAALEAAGCTPDMEADAICEAMIDAFASLSFNGLTGSNMTWAATGEVNKMPTAVVIENGVYVTAK